MHKTPPSLYLGQELGQVDIVDGFEEQNRLVLIHVLQLEVSSCRQHRLHGTHAVVVMMLGRQLLRAQCVGGNNLVGQAAHTGGMQREFKAQLNTMVMPWTGEHNCTLCLKMM